MSEYVAAAHYKNRIVFLKEDTSCQIIKEPRDYACKRAWFVAKNKSEDHENSIDLSYAHVNILKKQVSYSNIS